MVRDSQRVRASSQLRMLSTWLDTARTASSPEAESQSRGAAGRRFSNCRLRSTPLWIDQRLRGLSGSRWGPRLSRLAAGSEALFPYSVNPQPCSNLGLVVHISVA